MEMGDEARGPSATSSADTLASKGPSLAPDKRRQACANLSINTKLTINVDDIARKPFLRRGSIVCSPHEGDLACFTPTFPNVAGFEQEESRPLSWTSAVGALTAARPLSRAGSQASGAASPTLGMRDVDSGGSSPVLRASLSPPHRPPAERRSSNEGVRVFSPVSSTRDDDDAGDFLITTPAFMVGAPASAQHGDMDMDMCATPVGSCPEDDILGAGKPPGGAPRWCGDVDRNARRVKGAFGRRASLYKKKDYTYELLGRSRSDLTYDEHYQCCDLLGKGDFGRRLSSSPACLRCWLLRVRGCGNGVAAGVPLVAVRGAACGEMQMQMQMRRVCRRP
jgi:hypothetical protein